MEFEAISKDIHAGKFAPVYYFFGEEPYFTDKLTKLIEDKALNPGEEAFNKAVIYGSDFKAGKVLSELRSFPMMAQRRLVVVKEAQKIKKDELDKLESYLERPLDSTVFVLAYKGKGAKIDGRSKISKHIDKHGVKFESKTMYENQVSTWLSDLAHQRGYVLDPDALRVLVAYLGTNLALIESELQKIILFLTGAPEKRVTVQVVYEMINIDKDFNVFELLNFLGERDHSKCHFIINQMMKNMKDNPPVMILGQIFRYFDELNLLQSAKLTNEFDIARKLGKPNFVAKKYAMALRNYPLKDLKRNLVHLLEADLQLKGIQHTHLGHEHVMKMLIYKLLN